MYFSGKTPFTVRGTLPASVSNGVGVTLKLSADKLPNLLEHDDSATNEPTATTDVRIEIFFINKKV
jgi:hypothetical protein